MLSAIVNSSHIPYWRVDGENKMVLSLTNIMKKTGLVTFILPYASEIEAIKITTSQIQKARRKLDFILWKYSWQMQGCRSRCGWENNEMLFSRICKFVLWRWNQEALAGDSHAISHRSKVPMSPTGTWDVPICTHIVLLLWLRYSLWLSFRKRLQSSWASY